MIILYWGTPLEKQWHKLMQAIVFGNSDESYILTRNLVKMSIRIGNIY